MDHFLHRGGVLHAEGVAVPEIAAAVGTPFYLYSTATLLRHLRLFDEALAWAPERLVCFAVKALGNLAVLRTLAREGAGMDVVSGGELARARAAGVPGGRIVFSGVGKTREEMAAALREGVRQFNVESEPELEALSEVAASMGAAAPIALRVNPDVDARTHDKIATGRLGDKFGVPIARARAIYARAAILPGIEVVGVDVHIGSQIADLAPFEAAYRKVADLTRALRADGHAIRRLDLGGGLGIPYERAGAAPPPPSAWGEMARRAVGDLGCAIEIEPGRLIAGNAGILVSRVIYVKPGEGGGGRAGLVLSAEGGPRRAAEEDPRSGARAGPRAGPADEAAMGADPSGARLAGGTTGGPRASEGGGLDGGLDGGADPAPVAPAFVVLDAAMNDLLRPAMYGAHHDIVPVAEPAPGADLAAYDVVGPVCESGDRFARARRLPRLAAGDLVAFRSAGAYGAVMASEYNARPLVPEVLVRGDRWAVVRPRPTLQEMLGRDRIPDWLDGEG